MALHAVTVLHLSDLHERGPHDRETARRWRVLGEAWRTNLEEARGDGPVDLVFFTGDLANTGKAAEYEAAGAWLHDEVLAPLGIPRERLFLIPGNHDIDRIQAPEAWQVLRAALPSLDGLDVSRWLAGGRTPFGMEEAQRDLLLSRQGAYRDWLKAWGRAELLPNSGAHGRLGYRVQLRLDGRPFDVHVIGLDSSWLAGDAGDAGKLRLTDDQVLRHTTDARGRSLAGLRLALMHHPLTDLADGMQVRRLLAERVDLLLRGHVHETDLDLFADPDRRLLQLAAGCLYEGDRGDQHANSCHLIRILVDEAGRPQRYEIRFRSFSTRGFWHDDSSLYKAAHNGRLVIGADGRVLTEPRHFHVPFAENPYFTGREQALGELRTSLRALHMAAVTQPQALSGLGGVGKTQIALAYAYRHRTEYESVFWLDASSEEALSAGFAAAASALSLLGDKPERSVPDSAALFRLWLQKNPRWLLVLDNADEPRTLKRLLPTGTKGHILLASRTHDLQALGIVRPIEVQSFINAEAVDFLLARIERRSAGPAERAAAAELARQLGELPLALEQAAAFIVTQRMPIADYLMSYERHQLKLLEQGQPQLGDYPLSVATTWRVNFEKIQSNKVAVAALRLCAMLGPGPIPIELICRVSEEFEPRLGKALKDAERDPVQVAQVLEPLLRYSLLRRKDRTVSMHRLVQEVVRDSLGAADRKRYAQHLVNALSVTFPDPEESEHWPECERWLPHMLAAVEHSECFSLEGEWTARLHNQTALFMDHRQQWNAAEPLFKRAIELRREMERSPDASWQNRINLSIAVNNLAALYIERGRTREAERLLDEVTDLVEQRDGKEAALLAVLLMARAHLLRTSGRLVEAVAVMKRAVRLAMQDPQVVLQFGVRLLSMHAQCLLAQGAGKEAAQVFKQALVVCEELHGKHSDRYADVQLQHSRLLHEEGRFTDAETAARAVFEQAKLRFGADHPRTALAAQALTRALIERGKIDEGLALSMHVSQTFLALYGPQDLFYAESLRNLATCYRTLGQLDRAADLAEQALQIRQANPETRMSLDNELNELGLIYWGQRRLDDAERCFVEALAQAESRLGRWHEHVASLHNNLGLVFEERAEHERAAQEYVLAEQIAERCLGKTHPDYFLKLYNRASQELKNGRPVRAIETLKKVLGGWIQAYGEEHDKVVMCLSSLASAADAVGDVAEAEGYAQRSIRIAEKVFGPRHPDFARSLATLANHYRTKRLFQQALTYYEQAYAILEASKADSDSLAVVLGGVGSCLAQLNRRQEGLGSLRRALQLHEQRSGLDHPRLAPALNELGMCLFLEGEMAEAEELFCRARALLDKADGRRNSGYAAVLSNLSQLRRRQGNVAEATVLARDTLEIRTAVLGPNHAEVRTIQTELAELLAAQGRNEESERILAEAQAPIPATSSGGAHSRFMHLLGEGLTRRRLGQQGAAIRCVSESTKAAEEAFGPNSAEHMQALVHLQTLYVETNQTIEAEALLKKSTQILERVPTVQPELRTELRLLEGLLRRQQGRDTEAEQAFLDVVSATAAGSTKECMTAFQAYNALASLAETRGLFSQAEEHYRSAAKNLQAQPEGPEREFQEAYLLLNRCQALILTQRFEEADKLLAQAEALMNRSLPKVHPIRLSFLQRRVQLSRAREDLESARNMLQDAMRLADQIWPNRVPLHGQLKYDFGDVLATLGRLDDAIGATQESLAIYRQSGGAAVELRRAHIQLAQIERRAGKYAAAVGNMEQALAISRAALPHGARLFAYDAGLLGQCLQADDRLNESVTVVKSALATLEELRTAAMSLHKERMLLILALGGFLNQLGDRLGAQASFHEILDHYQNHPPKSDDERGIFASVLHARGDGKSSRQDFAGAREDYEQSLRVRREMSTRNASELGKTTWNLAATNFSLGELDSAFRLGFESLNLAVEGQDVDLLAIAGLGLGQMLRAKERIEEASTVLLEVHGNLTKALGPDDELTREVADELDKLRQGQGIAKGAAEPDQDVDS